MLGEPEQAPKLFGGENLGWAIGVHLVIVFLFFICSCSSTKLESSDEEIIPIDLEVVAHENLDGVEDEPPPEEDPVPAPPEPEPPPPVVEPDPPPPPEPEPPPVVEPPPEPPKQPEPPKPPKVDKTNPPEPPKETPEQARQRKIKEMQDSFTKTPPKNNGRTAPRPPNYKDLLMAGYKPSDRNMGLDASEEQRCAALIRRAFYERWSPRPPWSVDLRKMKLEVRFDLSGKVTGYTLVQSSNDKAADATVLSAAGRVKKVSGLSTGYLERNRTVMIEFEVTPM